MHSENGAGKTILYYTVLKNGPWPQWWLWYLFRLSMCISQSLEIAHSVLIYMMKEVYIGWKKRDHILSACGDVVRGELEVANVTDSSQTP